MWILEERIRRKILIWKEESRKSGSSSVTQVAKTDGGEESELMTL
jgi:hypothetical protein